MPTYEPLNPKCGIVTVFMGQCEHDGDTMRSLIALLERLNERGWSVRLADGVVGYESPGFIEWKQRLTAFEGPVRERCIEIASVWTGSNDVGVAVLICAPEVAGSLTSDSTSLVHDDLDAIRGVPAGWVDEYPMPRVTYPVFHGSVVGWPI